MQAVAKSDKDRKSVINDLHTYKIKTKISLKVLMKLQLFIKDGSYLLFIIFR